MTKKKDAPNTSVQQTEESYHRMIEEVEDYAILMLDDKGIIQNWNKGAEKIKGYKEEEIVGHHFSIFYTPEDQAAGLPQQLMEKARQKGKALHEGWRIRKGGTTFWGSIVITALHDEDDNIIGFTKVTRDLTERKESEDKLLRQSQQLESQNRELQQFAYAAAHDMKEPLRKIQFYYSAILEEISQEKQKTYLNRSIDAARRMQRLIDDLLAFTKVAEVVDQFEPVDLNEVVEEARQFYQETIEQQGAALSIQSLPAIKGIPFQIRQLFLNLFSNSLKYHHPERPLRISVLASRERDPGWDIKGTYLPKFYHRLTVRDNGIGFEPEYAEKIFSLFQRLHGREQYSGTGIGLSICKKIMDNHQGFIRAEGHPGEGAAFELYFPVR